MSTYFTDQEYRLLLAALSRERKVCEMVDKDCGEEHKLLRYMDSIERKIKRIQYNNKPNDTMQAIRDGYGLSRLGDGEGESGITYE